MSEVPDQLGLFRPRLRRQPPTQTEYVVVQSALNRVLAFTGRSIDDVVNDPIAKNQVLGYYKVYKQVERAIDVAKLERQWNPL